MEKRSKCDVAVEEALGGGMTKCFQTYTTSGGCPCWGGLWLKLNLMGISVRTNKKITIGLVVVKYASFAKSDTELRILEF